jgi:hypothetical protein
VTEFLEMLMVVSLKIGKMVQEAKTKGEVE